MMKDLELEAPKPTKAWVANFQGAVLAFGKDKLGLMLEEIRRGSVLSTPAAIVVTAEDQPLFEGHAFDMAQRGIVRRVFTSATDAHEWTAEQVRVLSAQAVWDLRRRASTLPC